MFVFMSGCLLEVYVLKIRCLRNLLMDPADVCARVWVCNMYDEVSDRSLKCMLGDVPFTMTHS
jgi:hypothetical protein